MSEIQLTFLFQKPLCHLIMMHKGQCLRGNKIMLYFQAVNAMEKYNIISALIIIIVQVMQQQELLKNKIKSHPCRKENYFLKKKKMMSSLSSLKHISQEMWGESRKGAFSMTWQQLRFCTVETTQAKEHSLTKNNRGIHAQCKSVQTSSRGYKGGLFDLCWWCVRYTFIPEDV